MLRESSKYVNPPPTCLPFLVPLPIFRSYLPPPTITSLLPPSQPLGGVPSLAARSRSATQCAVSSCLRPPSVRACPARAGRPIHQRRLSLTTLQNHRIFALLRRGSVWRHGPSPPFHHNHQDLGAACCRAVAWNSHTPACSFLPPLPRPDGPEERDLRRRFFRQEVHNLHQVVLIQGEPQQQAPLPLFHIPIPPPPNPSFIRRAPRHPRARRAAVCWR